jgi:hypothetical protein
VVAKQIGGEMADKLTPIEFDKTLDFNGILDKCHEVFKKTIALKDRPQLGEREIYIPLKWIENKAEIFWHAASIEPKPRLDIKPCTNDLASAFCEDNCISETKLIALSNGAERAKCIYRALRVGWIREVIDLFNANDSRVKYWEKVNSAKRKRLYIRYQEEEIDYLIVLEDKSEKRVQLITAFPVFFVSAKRDYDKDYKNYCKTQKTGNRYAKTGFSF